MEVESCTRLFGGKRALARRVLEESQDLGVEQLSWAPNSLAALALARSGVRNGLSRPLDELLDGLPISALRAVDAHAPTLARLGCTTLGQVRALPRAGISRRFDADVLTALDRAYGLRPDAHTWFTVPDEFKVPLELPARIEHASGIVFGARRLLMQLCAWLAARRCGVTAYTLHWHHDAMRARTTDAGGSLTVRTAESTRNIEHLTRLLSEHLAKVILQAPVADLLLTADEVRPMEERSLSLLPDPGQATESLGLVLERIAARLGPDRVSRPILQEDHRQEWQVRWQPASLPLPRKMAKAPRIPQPTLVLPTPMRLAMHRGQPMYHGALQLRSGPHRVEGGWWHRLVEDEATIAQTVLRDYWVALSEHAGTLWICQTRLRGEEAAWYLHGHFA